MDGYRLLCEWLRFTLTGAGRLNGLRSQCVVLGMRCWCSSNKAEGLKSTRIPLLGAPVVAESTVRVHVNAYGHSIQVKPKVKQFRKVLEQLKVKVLEHQLKVATAAV